MSTQKNYTLEELQVYTTIILRYYNYYLKKEVYTEDYWSEIILTDNEIRQFSEWYGKFIFDGDIRTSVKEFNEIKLTEQQQENEESI